MTPNLSNNFTIVSKAWTVVVLLCAVHFTITLFYYILHPEERVTFLPNPQIPLSRARGDALAVIFNIMQATVNGTESPEIRNDELQTCLETSPLLVGPFQVQFSSQVTLEMVRQENPELQEGGRWKPSDCIGLQRVAIIIPFRHRDEHLKYWLFYLHPLLQRQQLDYGIYVIEQDGETTFNRAKLLNVGFAEALKEYDYDCLVFSDVDIIPMDDRNIYKCYSQPRHIAVSMDKFGFRLPYYQYFGGVSALSKEQYLKINGLPNNYWGWGGEDDDIFNRLSIKGLSISRPNGVTGRCRMIRHSRDAHNEPNPKRFYNIAHTRQTMEIDGINSLKYQVIRIVKDQLFTKIVVDIGRQ
ncbi:beta-1,4-galactosyltransferase 1-like [Clupea harengus]|uniref:Beta-1,4-galactosyltransferase n=1 Tax=Clupea harengus TaxID=7950 RepID=A0A6P3W147_CLUHA|nr:beta-1,4-galactosyltransferase 1-like [Clupea harengus]